MKWYIKCLKQYADFNGRARRKEYWWFMLINTIITMILVICWMIPMFKMAFNAESGSEYDEWDVVRTMFTNPFIYIYLVYYLAMLIPSIAVTVRRLHDIGKSGFWVFLSIGGSLLGSVANMYQTANPTVAMVLLFIALAVTIVFLVWMFTNSDYGPNQYGPNPKGEGNPTEEITEAQ